MTEPTRDAPDQRAQDEQDLAEIKAIIKEHYPDATVAYFQTSDQNNRGFTLVDLNVPDISDAQMDALGNAVWALASSIGWDGVMRENWRGEAVVRLI